MSDTTPIDTVKKLVLLPGMDGTGKLLQPLVHALGDRIETQVIDYPAHEKLGYPELIDRIVAQIPTDGTDFAILAESFAGPIGLTLAQQHHPGLRGLILAVTFAIPPRKQLLQLTKLLPMPWLLAQPVPCWLAGRIMMGPAPPEDRLDALCSVMKEMDPEVIANRFEEVRDLELDPTAIELPVMYIQATDDLLLPESAVDDVRQFVRNLTVHRLEGGHLVLETQAEKAAELVADFLRAIPTAA
jgi:pimeloyl-ACP methyl ester carboxylesterase